MSRKKQVVTMVSIAIISFLLGTSVNFVATARDRNPFDEIWKAIYDLQRRVESIEESIEESPTADFKEFINEISRVELLSTRPIELEVIDEETGEVVEIIIVGYYYQFGVSGIWNVSKIQTEPIKERLNSLLSGLEPSEVCVRAHEADPFYRNEGYERQVDLILYCDRELSEAEIEAVRLLFEEYLAKP